MVQYDLVWYWKLPNICIDTGQTAQGLDLTGLFTHHFLHKDVHQAFVSVRTNKGRGPDDISGRLLKPCAKEPSPVLGRVF